MELHTETLLKVGSIVLAVIVWFIRLEGRINYLERQDIKKDSELEKLKTKIEIVDSELVKELSLIKESIARIEGRLATRE